MITPPLAFAVLLTAVVLGFSPTTTAGQLEDIGKEIAGTMERIGGMIDSKEPNPTDAESQFKLGMMYYNGDGVPQNYIQAHMWLNLAAAQGHPNAKKMRDSLTEKPFFGQAKMTPEQIAQAQELAKNWRPPATKKW
ncbi:MAG: SEL1-like repeat protein [Magnetococcales bacterium]|nr:SEL1-like repeat protein [Magnetococcales bacterium]